MNVYFSELKRSQDQGVADAVSWEGGSLVCRWHILTVSSPGGELGAITSLESPQGIPFFPHQAFAFLTYLSPRSLTS